MRGSCHLDRASNVETGVEYQNILVAMFFFYVAVKCILGHLQDIERISIKILQSNSSFFLIQQKTKK